MFTSGLRGEIKSTVLMMKPNTLAKAFEVASLQESTIQAINKYQRPKSFTPNKWNPYSPKPPNEIKTKDPWPKTNKPLNSYKTITPTDFQTKRNLGLWYKCDEKYTVGYVCKNRALNFILVDEVEESEAKEERESEFDEEEVMEISISA